MATRIQSLFLVQVGITVANNEDMFETIQYLDVTGAQIPLDGIKFTALFRTARDSSAVYLGLASPGADLKLPAGTPLGQILTSGGLLCLAAEFTQMERRPLAGSYGFDVLATADGITRRVVDGTLTLLQGYTR